MVDDLLGPEVLSVPKMVKGYPVPEGVLRVSVTDEKGKVCWRKIEEVRGTDTIFLSPKGEPQWMRNPLGRPKSARSLHDELPPANDTIKDLIRVKDATLRSDPLILTVENNPESADVLNQVILGIAEESASLRFERMEAERNGVDTSPLSMRRVAALKAIGDSWIKRKEQIQTQAVDMESPAFRGLFRFISQTFSEAMAKAGVRDELAQSVMSEFSKSLDDDWKSEAEAHMKKG